MLSATYSQQSRHVKALCRCVMPVRTSIISGGGETARDNGMHIKYRLRESEQVKDVAEEANGAIF